MSKKNIYDFHISELIYRLEQSSNLQTPYLQVSSSLLFNNIAPLNFNGNVSFTSSIMNVPLGYTVKANTHIISYPIAVPSDTSSNGTFTGTAVPIIFTSITDTFLVNFTITLEKPANPDIVITNTLTVFSTAAVFFGSKATNNSFITTGLSASVYNQENQSVLLPQSSFTYIYFVFPTGGNLPILLKDRNGLVIDWSNFTMTTAGGYDYYVLNWATSLPLNSYWELIYNI